MPSSAAARASARCLTAIATSSSGGRSPRRTAWPRCASGALIAHPDTLASFRRLLPPYSLNICAIRALAAALEDRAYLEWYVSESATSRQLIYDFCDARGLRYWQSEANFVLLRIGDDATAVVEAMGARGVSIRDRSQSPGCAGCIRITAGVVAHTRACLSALEDVLATRTR